MSVTAELSDGRRLEFPDGTDPAVVQATVKKIVTGAAPTPEHPKTTRLGGLSKTPFSAPDFGSIGYKAGGAVTDATGSPSLGYAANVALQAIPAVMGGNVATSVAPAGRALAESLMHSALKPGLGTLKTGGSEPIVKAALDEGINTTKGGIEKGWGIVNDLNDKISSAIKSSGATVDKAQVSSGLHPILKKFSNQVNPVADVNAIKSAETEFANHPSFLGANGMGPPLNDIPIQLAQEMKQGTYKVLAGKFGEQGSASTEAQKALAKGLKEGVASGAPEVAALNARESKLLSLMPVLERRVLVEANRNPAGIALLISNPTAAAAFMADKSSAFKSILARMLNAGQERIPQAVVGTGMALGESLNQQGQQR